MQETLLTPSEQQQHHSNAGNKEAGEEEKNREIVLVPLPPCRRPPRTRRVSPVEKELGNGDVYSGSLCGNVPHGRGKYVWSDGCMYEGEWKGGKPWGKGRLSWPSGATYEGEFVSGQISGQGTFVGSEGETYRGSWVSDRKHGFGEKRYGNGDVYEGWWRCNLQDGEGRYVWKNGSEYVGEWKGGAMTGNGVLVWRNGDRYDGFWENGVPKGNEEEERGVILKKRVSVDGSKSVNFPRICIWELDGDAGDITCDIVEGSMFHREIGSGSESENGGGFEQFQRSPVCCIDGGDVKKPGLTISKGHKNYDLMLNLQLGIRYLIYIARFSTLIQFGWFNLAVSTNCLLCFVFVLLDTLLGSTLRCCESLSQGISIRRRNSGRGSLRKGLRLHHRISQ